MRETFQTNTKSEKKTTTIGPIDIDPGESVCVFEKKITFPSVAWETSEMMTSTSRTTPMLEEEGTMCIPVHRNSRKFCKNIMARTHSGHTYSNNFMPFRMGYSGGAKDTKAGSWADINRGFGGQHVYLELSWTEVAIEAADNVEIVLVLSDGWLKWVSERGQQDMAKGAGGQYRFLDVWHRNKYTEKIVDVVLWEGELHRVPDGWSGMTGDLNKGRGGRFLHIVWKSARVCIDDVALHIMFLF